MKDGDSSDPSRRRQSRFLLRGDRMDEKGEGDAEPNSVEDSLLDLLPFGKSAAVEGRAFALDCQLHVMALRILDEDVTVRRMEGAT